MNTKPLTPTYSKSHAPAKHLLSAKASLKDLLTEGDVDLLVAYDDVPLRWAATATQKNSNADRFLTGLAITEWDVNEFVALISQKASEGKFYISSAPYVLSGPDSQFMGWLAAKPGDWHQKLYSLLYAELSPVGGCKRLKGLKIVRLSDGTYSVGSKCFFPGDGIEHDKDISTRRCSRLFFRQKQESTENARKFLEDIDVREVGEAEQVEAILKQQYASTTLKPKKGDLKRFIELVEKDTEKANFFAEYLHLQLSKDGKWRKPGDIFLDAPLVNTDLTAYYNALGDGVKRVALAESYRSCGVAIKRVVKFAEAVGAQTRLEIATVSCSSNPEWSYLSSVGGDRYTSSINRRL